MKDMLRSVLIPFYRTKFHICQDFMWLVYEVDTGGSLIGAVGTKKNKKKKEKDNIRAPTPTAVQMLLNFYDVSRLPTGHNGLIADMSDEELLVKSELPRYPGNHFSWPWLLWMFVIWSMNFVCLISFSFLSSPFLFFCLLLLIIIPCSFLPLTCIIHPALHFSIFLHVPLPLFIARSILL